MKKAIVPIGTGLVSFAVGVFLAPIIWKQFGYALLPVPDPNFTWTCNSGNLEVTLDADENDDFTFSQYGYEHYATSETPGSEPADWHNAEPNFTIFDYNQSTQRKLVVWFKYQVAGVDTIPADNLVDACVPE